MKAGILIFFYILLANSFVNAQEVTHKHASPYSFIENKGQWDEKVLFKSHFDGGNLWIEQHKMMFHLQDFSEMQEAHVSTKNRSAESSKIPQTVLHLNFLGSNEVNDIEKSIPTKNYYNYFIGNDKAHWASEVKGYGEAILSSLYDGIDLKLIEEKEQLKYEFHVQPNADANQILLEYVGHEKIHISKKGDLVIKTSLGEIIEQKPYAYQIINGSIREVKCEFLIEENVVRFDLGKFNPNVTLIIDPVLIFATYSGSITDNFGMTATYGNDGTAYSGGMIYGNAYPTPDPLAYNTTSNFTVVSNGTYGITDAFISKYSPDGSTMIWTTFIGGGDGTQGTETAQSMICDEFNNLYLYGSTSSLDFPIQGGYQTTHAGGVSGVNFYQNGVYFTNQGTDIYVVKISSNGQNLLASTYIGGTANDGVNYNPVSLPYNTFSIYDSLVTNYGDQFRGEISLDSVGACIIASCSRSVDFPLQNPFQATLAGRQDGVLFKLNSDLSVLQWSSYFGGTDNDACYSVKLDASDNVIFCGGTNSSDIPNTALGWQPTYNGGEADGFVAKLSPNGTALINVSYVGTANYDQAFFVETDRINRVYLVGQSAGGAFPVVNASFVNPGSGQYIMKLDSTLSTVVNSTVFGDGGPMFDISPSAFLVDICGNIYVSGWGAHLLQSSDVLANMPVTPDAIYSTAPNGFDFYLIAIDNDFSNLLYGSYFGEPGSVREHVDGGTSRFDKNGVIYQSVCGACGASVGGAATTTGAWSETDLSSNCNNLVFKFDFEITPVAEFSVDNNVGCRPFTVNFTNSSNVTDQYLWDFGNSDTTSIIFEPIRVYDSVGVFVVYLYVTDSACQLSDTAQITISVYDSLELFTSPDQVLCTSIPITMTAFSNGSGNQFVWSSNNNFTDTLNVNLLDSTYTLSPTGNATYYVQISNSGCSLMDSVNVQITSSGIQISGNDSLCFGDVSVLTASSLNPSITFNNFVWTPDSVLAAPSSTSIVTVNPQTTQYVFLSATSNTGCVATDSILIYVGSIPNGIVNATASDYTIPEGGTVTLFGEPAGYTYQWLPSSMVDNPNSLQTVATIDQSTLFTFTVTDGICTKSDTVFITTYEFQCEEPYLFVPNAFTPNGDGENDVLYVRGPLILKMEFRIYDRWGEMVFESFERPFGWDGTFRGKLMNPDVYDYYLKVTCIDNMEAIIKGNFTLIR
ncbi:MAG: gliding motility-associated C-terminal domain-containing protein [Fluviicola sp.]|nr:gliding motility-associated C-terminal domain-containing protein [Fluviicola sp.]